VRSRFCSAALADRQHSSCDPAQFHELDYKESEIAVEVLVRIEAIEKRKGWWFRAKRRLQ
jgi:hypothetical protein